MSNHLLPQNDFFIYVPLLQNAELPSRNDNTKEGTEDYTDRRNEPPELYRWIKVPLDETTYVYISPEQVDEEQACVS